MEWISGNGWHYKLKMKLKIFANICLFTCFAHILQCYTMDNFWKLPNLHENGQKRQNWRLTLVKFFVAEHGLVISLLPKLLAEV